MGPYPCSECQRRTDNDNHLCDECSECPLCGELTEDGKPHAECADREQFEADRPIPRDFYAVEDYRDRQDYREAK